MPPQTRTYIHLLPPELRLQIYRHAIQDHYDSLNQKRENIGVPWQPPCPLICRPSQIYPPLLRLDPLFGDEAASILFASQFPLYFAFLSIIKRLPATHRAHITHTGIRLLDRLPDKIARPELFVHLKDSKHPKPSAGMWAKGLKARIQAVVSLMPGLQELLLQLDLDPTLLIDRDGYKAREQLVDALKPVFGIKRVEVEIDSYNNSTGFPPYGRRHELADLVREDLPKNVTIQKARYRI